MSFIFFKVEGDLVVDFRLCQTHENRAVELAVDKDVDAGIFVCLLHGHEKIAGIPLHPDQGVVYS